LKRIILETILEVYDDVASLPLEIQELMNRAQQARKKAYAPYSHFKVGASILLEGAIFVEGNNQENAAYPSGLCAERVAVFHAGAQFPGRKIVAIGISAGPDKVVNETPIPPCGACRQSLVEYEVNQGDPIAVYFMGEQGRVVKSSTVKDLLPLIFDKSYLGL